MEGKDFILSPTTYQGRNPVFISAFQVLLTQCSQCFDRAEIVRWVSESMRPFSIVEHRGFRSLMKTGRPEYYIPSRSTVARDIKEVFKKVRKHIAKMLQLILIRSMTVPRVSELMHGLLPILRLILL